MVSPASIENRGLSGRQAISSRPLPDAATPPGTPPRPRRGASPLPWGSTALFCAPRNHFVALRNFAAADRARSSTLMRDSESKNAFSAVAKIEPTA